MPKKQSGAKKKAKEQKKQDAKAKKKDRPKVDPTFGLKNKKGKKNRQFVQNAHANMNAEEERKKQQRQAAKAAKEAQRKAEREMEAMFRTADGGSLHPAKHKKHKNRKQERIESESKVEKKEKELTIDDLDVTKDDFEVIMDKLREKFAKRTDLTPCNKENFEKWHSEWLAEKEAAKAAKAKRKMQKKGKSALTGRELFTLDPNSFKDDDDAETEYVFEKEEPESKDDKPTDDTPLQSKATANGTTVDNTEDTSNKPPDTAAVTAAAAVEDEDLFMIDID